MEMVTVSKTDCKNKEEKWIKHYCSSHNILLVGEGDFSFALCLAEALGSAVQMVATSLDSRDVLMLKYPRAATNLRRLEELGCTILHQVDAHTMSQHPLLKERLFHRIIFNFPHATLKWREHNVLQIMLHQELVKGFLRNARDMLTSSGEVHVTHKTAHPFSDWQIEKLAMEVGLRLVEEVSFRIWEYPGYVNKKGYGRMWDDTFPVGECSTFKFALS